MAIGQRREQPASDNLLRAHDRLLQYRLSLPFNIHSRNR